MENKNLIKEMKILLILFSIIFLLFLQFFHIFNIEYSFLKLVATFILSLIGSFIIFGLIMEIEESDQEIKDKIIILLHKKGKLN